MEGMVFSSSNPKSRDLLQAIECMAQFSIPALQRRIASPFRDFDFVHTMAPITYPSVASNLFPLMLASSHRNMNSHLPSLTSVIEQVRLQQNDQR
jgi:hypothetical protein